MPVAMIRVISCVHMRVNSVLAFRKNMFVKLHTVYKALLGKNPTKWCSILVLTRLSEV